MDEIEETFFPYNNKKIQKSKLNKVFICQPILSEANKNRKIDNKSNNLIISSSLKKFPLSKDHINLTNLKQTHSILKTTHFSSTPNINGYQPITKNKNSKLTYHSFNYKYIKPKTPVDLSLYTILALSKNKYLRKYNKDIDDNNKCKYRNKKNKNIRFLINKEYINECNEKNKNEKVIESKKKSMVFLSCFNNNFVNSEKIRFYNMMERLNKIKLFVEVNPKNKYKIIKNFLISIGLNNQIYYSKNKMNNFIKFIKKDFIVDPSKSFKDNIINILNNNNEYISYQNNLKNYGNILSSPNKTISQRIKNIMHINTNLYKSINLKYNTYDKYKINRYDLDLKSNMKKQKEANNRINNPEFLDIIKNPEKLMNSLENKIKDGKNDLLYSKTYSFWNKNFQSTNNININLVNSYDFDKLKKRNILTEYACFEKAKNNFDFQTIKIKYHI